LPVERLRLAPEAAVTQRVGRINRFGDGAFKTELAGVLQDEFAVAGLVAIVLNARLSDDQGLEQCLALD